MNLDGKSPAPAAGVQRMRVGQIVTYLFDEQLSENARASAGRRVYEWIRKGDLRAVPVEGRKGVYDVDLRSLEMLKLTLPPGKARDGV